MEAFIIISSILYITYRFMSTAETKKLFSRFEDPGCNGTPCGFDDAPPAVGGPFPLSSGNAGRSQAETVEAGLQELGVGVPVGLDG